MLILSDTLYFVKHFLKKGEIFLKPWKGPYRDPEQAPPRYRCHLCGGEIYCGDTMWLIGQERICEDCIPDYACALLRPFALLCGQEEVC